MGGLDPTGKSPVFSSHPQLFYPPKFARSSIDPKPVCTGFEPHAFSPNIKFYCSALFETPKGCYVFHKSTNQNKDHLFSVSVPVPFFKSKRALALEPPKTAGFSYKGIGLVNVIKPMPFLRFKENHCQIT